jgi:hypothetical protein
VTRYFTILDDYWVEAEPIDYKEAERVWQIYLQLKEIK